MVIRKWYLEIYLGSYIDIQCSCSQISRYLVCKCLYIYINILKYPEYLCSYVDIFIDIYRVSMSDGGVTPGEVQQQCSCAGRGSSGGQCGHTSGGFAGTINNTPPQHIYFKLYSKQFWPDRKCKRSIKVYCKVK